jgi:predicted acyltransferase
MGSKPSSGLAASSSSRLLSIDALRGFDMFWIIGGDKLIQAVAKWRHWSFEDQLNDQLEHVAWEGFHFEDLIFPLFLFLVGAVIPFSLAAHRQRGESTPRIWWRILRRTVVLFVLGLIYYGLLQLDFRNARYVGVLQRIAVCYGVAALLSLYLDWRGLTLAVVAILLGYWALLAFVPAPGSVAGDYTKLGNLAGYIDKHYLPGKIPPDYYGYGDNEGYLSTIPAVATALLGALAGLWLRSRYSPGRKVLGLLLAGGVCLGVGYAWHEVFPIIKNIWTSSFVLYAGGWSLLLLALFYGIIDALGFRRWAFFFVVIGSNAIVIYLLVEAVDFAYTARFLFGGLARLAGMPIEAAADSWSLAAQTQFTSCIGTGPAPYLIGVAQSTAAAYSGAGAGPVVLALGVLALEWLLLLYLYRNKIFLRA